MTAFPKARFRFGQKARLKNRRDFEGVRKRGERLTNGCLVGNWERLSPGASSRLGVITPGKLGNAVLRSRARRLLRESFRRHQFDLSAPIDLVLVARASIAGKAFPDVERDFLALLRRGGLLK